MRKELKAARAKAELDIAEAIQKALAEFRKATELSIRDVRVNLFRAQTVGGDVGEYIVKSVRCDIRGEEIDD